MATYKPLQSSTLTTTATSFTFSGIDQNYTDLVFVYRGQAADATNNMYLRFNGSSASYYSTTLLVGNGSAASSTRFSSSSAIVPDYFGGNVNNSEKTYQFHIANYSNTTTYKTTICKTSIPDKEVVIAAGLWRGSTGSSTEAITSVTLLPGGGSFAAGSTFDLYGIKSGAPQALGGDVVTTDGNYWYHTFNSTQTFTPLRQLTVDYLVVAGGGSGASTGSGNDAGGGGGGAGGLRSTVTQTGGNAVGVNLESPLSLTGGIGYTVTIGAGGTAPSGSLQGVNGNDSVFGSITSTGGGGGGSYAVGSSGGSGGGGGFNNLAGGAGTANQGFAGGRSASGLYGNGGGGGAGAVGGLAVGSNGGNGGAGVSNSISGSSVTYGGGGGGARDYANAGTGGTGGSGGGGASGYNANGTSGTANTGGGGGGVSQVSPSSGIKLGGNGGSGIVIVRYPV